MLRSELGQIFLSTIASPRRTIKSMIVCEQLAISTSTRVEELWRRTFSPAFRFAFKVSLRFFFLFKVSKVERKKCENRLWIESHSHLMHRFVLMDCSEWSLLRTQLIPLGSERSIERGPPLSELMCDVKRRWIFINSLSRNVCTLSTREKRGGRAESTKGA